MTLHTKTLRIMAYIERDMYIDIMQIYIYIWGDASAWGSPLFDMYLVQRLFIRTAAM